MEDRFVIEICVAHIQSAIAAQDGGADRIELCDNLYEGGTTPSYALIKMARAKLDIGLNVMIRPRGSDFYYSELEFELIKEDIRVCKNLGVDGVVVGILLPNGNIDTERTQQLVDLAFPMKTTFHRAFDVTPDPYKAMEDIINLGVDRILTSGQKNKATSGSNLIKRLIIKADNRIIIMPGSGINEKNIEEIKNYTGAREFHLTGRTTVESKMRYRKEKIYFGGLPQIPEYEIQYTDTEKIRKIVSLVNEAKAGMK